MKDTGIDWIGEIPKHWKTSKLKFLSKSKVQYGINISNDNYVDSGVRFLRTTDITDLGLLKKGGVYLDPKDVPTEYLLDNDDVLFSRSGTVGRAFLVDRNTNELQMTFAGYLVRFSFGDYDLSKYIFYISHSDIMKNWLRSVAVSSTIDNVNGEKYGNFSIPLPPMEEQKKIASYLDDKTKKIDLLIENIKKKIELLEEQRSVLINQVVTKGLDPNVEMKDSGIDWIGDIPKHWKVIKFKKYIEPVVDYRGRTPEKVDEGVFLITAKNIKNGKIDYNLSKEYTTIEEQNKIFNRGIPSIGDVLFTTEAPLGEVANVDNVDVAIAQRAVKFRAIAEHLDNYFLKYSILADHFQQSLKTHATGSTAKGIKGSKLGLLDICLPPIGEQKIIAEYLDDKTEKIDLIVENNKKKIELIEEQRSALISNLVTGKIRVS
ncbi:MAG: restriction endonuclease subunit S [Dehalococcoidia bacterium]